LRIEKDSAMADRVYSRSAVQRYVLQKLAMELHGPLEQHREEVPFEVFRDVLQAPNSVDFSKLNPNVETRPYHHPSGDRSGSAQQLTPLGLASNLTPGSFFGRSQSSYPNNSFVGGAPPFNSLMMPMSMQQQQQQQRDGSNLNTTLVSAGAGQQQQEVHQPRVVVDSASFMNMHRGVRVRSYKPPTNSAY
jgi:hypothetical protein